MTNRKSLIIIAAFLTFLASCTSQVKKGNQSATDEKFKVGQVWKFNDKNEEDTSTMTILKIENYENSDTIIHIRVDGIKLHSPNAPGGYTNFIEHMPFSKKSILKSATKLVGQNNNLPDFSEGYDEWKSAWDNGKGGYFTVSVKEIVMGMDSAMQQK